MGEPKPDAQRLTPADRPGYILGELRHRYERIATGAIYVANRLDQAWQRPIRHNRKIERAALFHVVGLELDCKELLEFRYPDMLLPADATASERYELRAGALTVRHLLPYNEEERGRLRGIAANPLREWEFASDHLERTEPRLAERWHQWLWADAHGDPQNDASLIGASAVLAEACQRLGAVTPRIISELPPTPAA